MYKFKKLKEAEYIEVNKSFKDNYPQTICLITKKGVNAFETYVKVLQEYIKGSAVAQKSKG